MNHLPRQHRQRIQAWRQALKQQLYTPVGEVSFCGTTTLSRLTPEEAATWPMQPFPAGTKWGACWEYGWFQANITVPEDCAGKRLVLLSGLGGEQLVYVDGVAVGSNDKGHDAITLRKSARAGETIQLLIEGYAGHGARLEEMMPCPPEKAAVPPVTAPQCTVRKSVLAIWQEDAYQLMLDVEILCDLLSHLPEKSLRHQRVAKALMEFTYTADLELPLPERLESFRRARAVLAPALACRNGSTAPTMWMLGQSHIDLAWMWPEEETWHKVARTYANQLSLMEEYPEYRFLLCEPKLLDMLRMQHPALWDKVRDAFSRGQVDADGAFYIECDTNLPSGESLIRQLMRGKAWFRDVLGVETKVAWQPDTFGYSGALPQILRKLDIPYFATQKLLRADPECERFPYQNFIWEGIDGSTVEALSFFKNNAQVTPSQFCQRWEENRTQTEDIDTLLYPFGFGDGGGGATRDMLESVRRMQDLEGLPRARYGTLRGFFEETARQAQGNRWVGELYLSWHRGTYTVQRKTKQGIQRLERMLHEAEMWLATADSQTKQSAQPVLAEAWDTLMFCQFHDVAGGVGIRRVHQEAEQKLAVQLDKVGRWLASVRREVDGGGMAALMNTLPWKRTGWVKHAGRYERVCAQPGGMSLYRMSDAVTAGASVTQLDAVWRLENAVLAVDVDASGAIIQCVDKRNQQKLLSLGQTMNDWRLYEDVETVYDAWEMDRDWRKRERTEAFKTRVTMGDNTPERVSLLVERTFGQSHAVQEIMLYADGDRIEFETRIDWQERRKLLKVHFVSNVLAEDALHEIQFGYLRRPCHASHAYAADRYESCSQRWTAMCEENRGFAILSDGIRGVSTDRGEIALSLLRAPLVPDDTCDRGMQTFRYALMPFATSFAQSGVVRAGYEFAEPLRLLHVESVPDTKRFWCEGEAVVLETIKPAEDGSADVIVRLYESLRTTAATVVHLPWTAKVYRASMDEKKVLEEMETSDCVSLTLRPFEIVTLRLSKTEE